MRLRSLLAFAAFAACQPQNWGGPGTAAPSAESSAPPPMPPPPVASSAEPTPSAPPSPAAAGGRVVGVEGVAAFDALSAADKDALRATKVVFFHASVGANILGGAAALGFPFAKLQGKPSGLSERDYGEHNGDPIAKLDAFAAFSGDAKLVGAKLCWTDFDRDTDLRKVESAYERAVARIRGPRVFHVAPPLMTAKAPRDNPMRLEYTAWLKSTFGGGAVVLDLPAIQSTGAKGKACTDGATRVMCDAWASDEGHLNDAGSARVAKAFLYALHLARTLPAR